MRFRPTVVYRWHDGHAPFGADGPSGGMHKGRAGAIQTSGFCGNVPTWNVNKNGGRHRLMCAMAFNAKHPDLALVDALREL